MNQATSPSNADVDQLRQPTRGPEASTQVRPIRVVAIGGGTGLSTLLRGLRKHVIASNQPAAAPGMIADLAAVVTVTDDGGSSGRLRKGFNMLPPGDLRNCMVALSEEGGSAGPALRPSLQQGRFTQGAQLRQSLCRRAH
jgi:uncharacterized cofD-like protein